MQRYKRCAIKIDKEYVKRHILFKYGSLAKYCKENHISRTRLWVILSKPHSSINEKCLQELVNNLGLSISNILL